MNQPRRDVRHADSAVAMSLLLIAYQGKCLCYHLLAMYFADLHKHYYFFACEGEFQGNLREQFFFHSLRNNYSIQHFCSWLKANYLCKNAHLLPGFSNSRFFIRCSFNSAKYQCIWQAPSLTTWSLLRRGPGGDWDGPYVKMQSPQFLNQLGRVSVLFFDYRERLEGKIDRDNQGNDPYPF